MQTTYLFYRNQFQGTSKPYLNLMDKNIWGNHLHMEFMLFNYWVNIYFFAVNSHFDQIKIFAKGICENMQVNDIFITHVFNYHGSPTFTKTTVVIVNCRKY